MIDTLIAALREAVSEEVVFYPSVPSAISGPAVIVAPSDPFLMPATHGAIEESWDVLVVVSQLAEDKGLKKLRSLSLKVRESASQVGALWVSTSGPRYTSEGDRTNLLMVNKIRFKYVPTTIEGLGSS